MFDDVTDQVQGVPPGAGVYRWDHNLHVTTAPIVGRLTPRQMAEMSVAAEQAAWSAILRYLESVPARQRAESTVN